MAHSRSPPAPSCPALSRASTSSLQRKQDVDGRDKPGHDGWASIYSKHRHGKLRQIKPEQLGCPATAVRPGDGIELFPPVLRRLAEIVAAAAERGVALVDEAALLPGQCQRRAMAVGFRTRDHPQERVVDVAVELGKARVGADRL